MWPAAAPRPQLLPALGFGAVGVSRDGDVVVRFPEPQLLRADGREVVLPAPAERAPPDPVAVSDDSAVVAGNLVHEVWGGQDSGGSPQLPRPVRWEC